MKEDKQKLGVTEEDAGERLKQGICCKGTSQQKQKEKQLGHRHSGTYGTPIFISSMILTSNVTQPDKAFKINSRLLFLGQTDNIILTHRHGNINFY